MQLKDDECLLGLKPLYMIIFILYGISEGGLNWFITFQDQHRKLIGMKPAQVDPCILSERKIDLLICLTALQVDDTFGHGTDNFFEKGNFILSSSFARRRPKYLVLVTLQHFIGP